MGFHEYFLNYVLLQFVKMKMKLLSAGTFIDIYRLLFAVEMYKFEHTKLPYPESACNSREHGEVKRKSETKESPCTV